jgi:hypothetical protein
MESTKQVPSHVRGRGIQRQLFPQERDETPGCLFNATPEDTLNFTPTSAPPTSNPNTAVLSDIEAFADFMRMLAPPTPAPDTPSTANGRALFAKIGCAHCHTPSFTTGKMIASGSSTNPSAALSNQTVNLFSDLLVHHMGRGLAMLPQKLGLTEHTVSNYLFRIYERLDISNRVELVLYSLNRAY